MVKMPPLVEPGAKAMDRNVCHGLPVRLGVVPEEKVDHHSVERSPAVVGQTRISLADQLREPIGNEWEGRRSPRWGG